MNTARTTSDLLALLADNSSADISPQDMRDVLVTVHGVYGEIYTTGGSGSQSVDNNGDVAVAQWDTDGESKNVTTDAANDQITVDVDGVYRCRFFIAYESDATTETFTFKLRKDGVAIPGAVVPVTAVNGIVLNASVEILVDLTAGEDIDVSVVSDSGSANTLDIKEAQLSIHKIG